MDSRKAQARLAAITRHRPDDKEAIAEARAVFLNLIEEERRERFRRARERIAANLAIELPNVSVEDRERMARIASELVTDEW